MTKRLISGVSVFALLVSGGALAQEMSSPNRGTPTEGAVDDGGLRDIIVTAQRRPENLQNAAIAITAVGADELARARVSPIPLN